MEELHRQKHHSAAVFTYYPETSQTCNFFSCLAFFFFFFTVYPKQDVVLCIHNACALKTSYWGNAFFHSLPFLQSFALLIWYLYSSIASLIRSVIKAGFLCHSKREGEKTRMFLLALCYLLCAATKGNKSSEFWAEI